MDRFSAMKIFVRIVQLGSFTAAADELGATQSSISKKIAALEHSLGSSLMVRTNRQILLTEVGANFYESCLSILGELEEAEAQAKDYTLKPQGNLRVNVPVSFGLRHVTPHLPAFLKRYPDIKLEFSTLDRQIDLVSEGVDAIIRVGTPTDSSLVARKLADSPRLILASPSYLKQHTAPKNLEDLKRHNCLVYSYLTTGSVWHFEHQGKDKTIQVRATTLQSGSVDAILECALAGIGIAVLPRWLVHKELERGTLVTIMQDYVPSSFSINAMYPQNHYIPLKVRCFVNFFKELYAQDTIFQS